MMRQLFSNPFPQRKQEEFSMLIIPQISINVIPQQLTTSPIRINEYKRKLRTDEIIIQVR